MMDWSSLIYKLQLLFTCSPRQRGLSLPSLTCVYKKLQASCHTQLLSSVDPYTRRVAEGQPLLESKYQRNQFRPAVVMNRLAWHPSSLTERCHARRSICRLRKALAATGKSEVRKRDEESCGARNLPRQGHLCRSFSHDCWHSDTGYSKVGSKVE